MKKISKFAILPIVLGSMVLCMSMTTPINSQNIQTVSSSASDFSALAVAGESWTWTELGKNAAAGAVGGAVGGAAAGALAGGVGAGPGALAGGVAGAVGGAVGNAVSQAWDYFFGASTPALDGAGYPETALN